MASTNEYDAVIVGSGPNGLAAAVRLAQAGARVQVIEAERTIGGGTRTVELTLDGYLHDVCSAIHPLGLASPFFRQLPLEQFGLTWVQPDIPVAHPLDGGDAVLVHRSLEEAAAALGPDSDAYAKSFRGMLGDWQALMEDVLGPFPFPPRHPLVLIRFGWQALRSASGWARSSFRTPAARAVFAGMSAHSNLPLHRPGTAAFGLILHILTHAVGWPLARGGSQGIAQALADYLRTLEGEISTGNRVCSLADLPPCRAALFDLTPRGVLGITGDTLAPVYRSQLEKYRYSPGVCKVDWALDGPIPWAKKEVARAGTVHVGGTMEEIAAAEQQVWDGQHPRRPFVLLAQQSQFDSTRAPQGKHTAWAYCHVPPGSTQDLSARIEDQVERFAPGFKERLLARHVTTADGMEAYNPNYVGGDINGGVQDLRQLFTRPAVRWNPYRIPTRESNPGPRLYICSSSTPPGGGVHGMCGYHAAETALKDLGWK